MLTTKSPTSLHCDEKRTCPDGVIYAVTISEHVIEPPVDRSSHHGTWDQNVEIGFFKCFVNGNSIKHSNCSFSWKDIKVMSLTNLINFKVVLHLYLIPVLLAGSHRWPSLIKDAQLYQLLSLLQILNDASCLTERYFHRLRHCRPLKTLVPVSTFVPL